MQLTCLGGDQAPGVLLLGPPGWTGANSSYLSNLQFIRGNSPTRIEAQITSDRRLEAMESFG